MTKPIKYSLISFTLIAIVVVGLNLIYLTHQKKKSSGVVPIFTDLSWNPGDSQELVGVFHTQEQAVADKISDLSVNEPVAASENTKTSELNKVASGGDLQLSIPHMEFPPEVDSVGGLLKISSNVFIGRVIRRVGADPGHAFPTTRFEVEVLENIKGNAPKEISFLQGGVGLSAKNGKFYVTEGDVPNITPGKFNPDDVYLKTGATYLFAAGYDAKKDLYGIGAPPYDRELITTNVGLDKAQIMTAAHANARVQQFFDLADK